ncbi:sulfotransferase family 2 domain-containing protein [Marinicella gelatinilytica]|uniref:sulfotransferase family 2 domain-containing protein n=1 Tax=Marinicella gelatinilytica TaxID=2996017 RepID=UPI002260C8D5|nr:sulfotransferase family 2 domain-containing protein [Marinicella gelatinilytica]MCX7544478.1 sulfotransferase family 2 domain-containing protein [Marinicella gelatinilytica]
MHNDTEYFQQACGFLTQWVLTPEQALQNQSPRLVFSHVPKTGGTTLETIVAKNYRLSDVLHLNAPEFKQYPDILSLKKNPPRFICGHHPLHSPLYQHLPQEPLFHFTMLREPVARVLSYYNYVRGKTDHPLHQQAYTLRLAEFVESGVTPELNNGQARRFSGYLHQSPADDETLFITACDALQNCFSLVGTTACFDETLLLLHRFLGFTDLFYQRRNQSRQTLSRDDLTDSELELIAHYNQADAQLYHYTENRLNDYILTYLKESDIKRFAEANSQNHQWSA